MVHSSIWHPRRKLHFLGFPSALVLFWGCVQTVPTDPVAEDPLADRPGSGTATVSGVVLSAEGETPLPLGGVRLSLGDAVAFSNVDGTFSLTGVRAGPQKFLVDGSTAQSGDGAYGQFATRLVLVEEQVLVIERPIYLPFIPLTARRMINPDAVTTIMSGDGIELVIEPGGAHLDGKPYEDEIAIVSIATNRTPMALPRRFDGVSRVVWTIQPIGIEFPVAAKLTVPLDDASSDRTVFNTVWSFEDDRADFVGNGIAQRKGDLYVTMSGGIRTSGYHLLSGLQFEVREPCENTDVENDARLCLAAASRTLDAIQLLAKPSLPGARTLLGRLNQALRTAAAGLATVDDILGVTNELYGPAADGVRAYQRLYRELADLDSAMLASSQMRVACSSTGACDPVRGGNILAEAHSKLDTQIAAAQDNVARYATRFDRLSASLVALEPYFTSSEAQTTEGAGVFFDAARELDAAYQDFAPFASPIDAYDQLVGSLNALEQASRDMVKAVSVPAPDDAPAILQRVCADRGATSVATTSEGFAELRPGEASGRLLAECALVAIDEQRGLAGVPIWETELFASVQPPLLMTLDGLLAERSLSDRELRSGTLSEDSPVHRWSVTVEARHGWHAAFESNGPALAGLMTGGAIQIARDGGFDVFNLSDVESFSCIVLGMDLHGGDSSTYELSGTVMEPLIDFAGTIDGSFDVNTRAAAILFDGTVGDRIVVERPCCDPSGTLFTHALLEPDGAAATRVDFEHQTPGTGDEAFELAQDGLHRVVISPFPGQFAEYQFTIGRASAGDPKPVDLATDTVVSLDQVGAIAVYTFVGGAGQIAVIEGIGASGFHQVVYTLIGPDGNAVSQGKSLYFDGSSFALREETLPLEGSYRLVFSSRFSGDALVGTFTFRVTTRNP